MQITLDNITFNTREEDITIYGVFYKSNRHWWSRLIKWWTHTSYSHCELMIKVTSDKSTYFLVGISDEQKVRIKPYDYENKKDRWDIVPLVTNNPDFKPYNLEEFLTVLEEFFKSTQGAHYDWAGIMFTDFFNRGSDNKNKYTCSEWLGILVDKYFNKFYPKKYIRLIPQDLYDFFTDATKH